jgi:hypothetical protein
MAHEDQFTAIGPIQSGSGAPFSAFSTRFTDPPFAYGVNVQGKNCGVYANVSNGGNRDIPTDIAIGIGVCGVGDLTGVAGECNDVEGAAGVRGVAGRRGVGVIGKAYPPGPGRSSRSQLASSA